MKQQPRFPAATALLLCAVLGACQAQEPKPDPATVQKQVQALKDKTLKQLVPIPAGGFWLGDVGPLMTEELQQAGTVLGPDAPYVSSTGYTWAQDNKPPRWVTLDAFQMQAYKITYADFDVYVAANQLPAHPPKGDELWQKIWQRARFSDDTPAGVTWPQAKGYCQWLGQITGLPFDLPTEAQWEYAVSTGRKTHHEPYPTPDGLYKEGRDEPSDEEKKKFTKGYDYYLYPIGHAKPTKWGLYDTVFNGFEWVNDWYAPDAYQTMTDTHNPKGPATGTEKVKRGKSIGDSRTFTGFPHVYRNHDLPEGKTLPDPFTSKEELFPYVDVSFRCIVNQAASQAPAASASAQPAASQ